MNWRPLYEIVACVNDGLDGGGGATACPVVVGLHDVLVAVAVVLPNEICMAWGKMYNHAKDDLHTWIYLQVLSRRQILRIHVT